MVTRVVLTGVEASLAIPADFRLGGGTRGVPDTNHDTTHRT